VLIYAGSGFLMDLRIGKSEFRDMLTFEKLFCILLGTEFTLFSYIPACILAKFV
jgi:hypothetical protein